MTEQQLSDAHGERLNGHTPGPDWYERRDQLSPGMIFATHDGYVKLDRRVPGDGTKWYVADWSNGWAYYDGTIEPGDLLGHPLCCDGELSAVLAKAAGK